MTPAGDSATLSVVDLLAVITDRDAFHTFAV